MPTLNVVRVRRDGFSNINAMILPSSDSRYFFGLAFIERRGQGSS